MSIPSVVRFSLTFLLTINLLILITDQIAGEERTGTVNKSRNLITKSEQVDGENKVLERRITIFVDGDPALEQQPSNLDSDNKNREKKKAESNCRETDDEDTSDHSDELEEGKESEEAKFYLDESTKLIYIDKNNEDGLLIGEINNENNEQAASSRVRPKSSSKKEHSGDIFERFYKNHGQFNINEQNSEKATTNKPTNYSLFLVSRCKDHIAIMIDIEQIDFEPIVNCEYQEVRFSIVGEISTQLLTRKNGTDTTEEDNDSSSSSEDAQAQTASSASSEGSHSSKANTEASPPLPVSEAMAMLLNSPLNKTILNESDDSNDFKIIDSTIDYLHEETCTELNGGSTTTIGPSTRRKSNQNRRKTSRQKSQNSKSYGKEKKANCPEDTQEFKNSMSNKLSDYFEWDDFKIICGKIRQLVIPMRSLKLSVFSDEFSPNSKFVIRYKFISDPSLLPAQDNGKYYCRNRNIIELSLKCNGYDDCGDGSDESIKICGYPTGRTINNEPQPTSSSARSRTTMANQQHSSTTSTTSTTHHNQQASNGSHHSSSSNNHASKKNKLTYVNGDVLHCCNSNDWMSIIPQSQADQVNLQSIIGESMNLFSGPLFAPTKSKPRTKINRRIKRIVGGSVAQKGAWSGQASLQYELLEPLCHFCAGTLIHPQYVLTAGHCITKDGLSRGIKVVFGAHDLRQLSGNHIQVRYVDDAQIYPGVNVKQLSFDWENDMNNDIALLRLNAPILITPHVAPACLPPFNTPLAVNTTCRSIGWGQTHGSGSSNLLKHLSLKVVESSLCSKELFDRDNENKNDSEKTPKKSSQTKKRGRFVGDHESTIVELDQYSDLTMVCVNNDLGHGICQGDSGGPLYCDRVTPSGERCTEIYGVASFIIQYATVGAMCAVENLPGIFGEVSSKTEWISSTMKMFEQSYRLKYS